MRKILLFFSIIILSIIFDLVYVENNIYADSITEKFSIDSKAFVSDLNIDIIQNNLFENNGVKYNFNFKYVRLGETLKDGNNIIALYVPEKLHNEIKTTICNQSYENKSIDKCRLDIPESINSPIVIILPTDLDELNLTLYCEECSYAGIYLEETGFIYRTQLLFNLQYDVLERWEVNFLKDYKIYTSNNKLSVNYGNPNPEIRQASVYVIARNNIIEWIKNLIISIVAGAIILILQYYFDKKDSEKKLYSKK